MREIDSTQLGSPASINICCTTRVTQSITYFVCIEYRLLHPFNLYGGIHRQIEFQKHKNDLHEVF